ncbi:MAG: B12-binding domain-containing radical SAM protein [Treponema sp.]|jgi:radical SAM superfamily enzyme YgiQ (UPF0313 family)|nr:B12-binding domain-containing radical SAM protein [Treponema sp.]
MRIGFINPPFKAAYGRFSRESRSPAIAKSGTLYYPLWLIYAAAYAGKHGHEVFFLDAPAEKLDEAQSLKIIREQAPGAALFVLDTSTPSIKSDARFGAELKKICPGSFVILVGTHPSACPEETLLLDRGIDAVARGEYDLTITELAEALETGAGPGNARGITWRDAQTGEIQTNQAMPYLEDLDQLPFAAEFIKTHLNVKDYFFSAATYPAIQLFSGRGCPFRCDFCVYPQTMHGHTYRPRSPENVADEMQYIAEHFPEVKEVVIEDDTFTTNKQRVLQICALLVEKGLHTRLKWLCNARVDLDLATMRAMKQAGCRLIIPGIESGSQMILDNIRKGTKTGQFVPFVRNARKAGLLVHACYMVGNRGETKETLAETLELALALNTDTAQFFPLIPYPGTEAYLWAKENGYIHADYERYCTVDGGHNAVLDIPGLPAFRLLDFCNTARRRYYLRPRYLLHRIRTGLANRDDFTRALKAFWRFKRYLFAK